MKNFLTAVSTMAYSANAWGSDDNTWLETYSLGDPVVTKLIDVGGVFLWNMSTQTVLNTDTGIQYLRVIHDLTADIFEDDEIIFEVAFQTSSAVEDHGLLKFNADNVGERMGEDAFRCALTINSTDNRFWKATLSDGYYMCDGAA